MSVKRIIFNTVDVICKVVLVVIAVMFIIRGIRYAYDTGLQIFDQQPVSAVNTSTIVFTVTGADSVMDIGRGLEEKGLIKDARLFWIQERLSVYHEMIGAGTYELSPSMTPDQMIEIMAAPTVEARKKANLEEKEAKAREKEQEKKKETKSDKETEEGAQAEKEPVAGQGEEEPSDGEAPQE
ncbi:MAG: endolytic transglycosylase MltG [Lachnospiraceae bacterium]|nr:endolytic transglycosylase MltG [Lachnospiraceae bacterium]